MAGGLGPMGEVTLDELVQLAFGAEGHRRPARRCTLARRQQPVYRDPDVMEPGQARLRNRQ